VIDCKPDALIMADAGLIMMVKEKWPEQVVHRSVQANTTNWAAVKFWQKMGVERFSTGRTLHRRDRALRCVGRCNTGREVERVLCSPTPTLKLQ
jgi:collagenase-like PrtC family protease